MIRWYTSGSSERKLIEYFESLSRSTLRVCCGSYGAASAAVPAGAAADVAANAAAAAAPAAAAAAGFDATAAGVAATAAAAGVTATTATGDDCADCDCRSCIADDPVDEGGPPACGLVARDRGALALLGEDRGSAHARAYRKKSWQVRATLPVLRLLSGRR